MQFEPVNNVVNKYMEDLKADIDQDFVQQKTNVHDEPKITEVGEYYKPSKFEDRKIKSQSDQPGKKQKNCFPDPECFEDKATDKDETSKKEGN